MNKNTCLKVAAGIVPFAVVLPHWLKVLTTSPVDLSNMITWGGLSAVLLIAAYLHTRKGYPSEPSGFWLVLCAFAWLGFIAGLALGIWGVSMSAAVVAAFSITAAMLGTRRACWFAPAFVALLLAVPGVIFWGSRLGVGLVGQSGPACMLSLEKLDKGGLSVTGETGASLPVISRKAALTPTERVLFRTSTVENRTVAVGETFMYFSEVTLGDDIHEIHPPSFCLRSHGFNEELERTITVDGLEISEAVAVRDGRERRIVWTWYTDEHESTASFVRFRLKSRGTVGGWRRYTLTATETPVTRLAFSEFIRLIRVPADTTAAPEEVKSAPEEGQTKE